MWSIAFWNASWWLLLASAKNALYLSAPAPLTRPPLRESSFVLSALSSRLGTRCSSISASPFVVTRSYTYPPPCCHQAKPITSAEGLSTGVARTHIPHLQTSTIGIICSCLQPVFAPLGLYLGDQGVLFEKCSFDKEGQIDDYRLQLTNVTTLASASYQAHHAKGPFLANFVLKRAANFGNFVKAKFAEGILLATSS